MFNLLAYNFWYNLWNPVYEALFGNIRVNDGWLNWGFWFSMLVIVVLAIVYVIVFWAMKPKHKKDDKTVKDKAKKDEKKEKDI